MRQTLYLSFILCAERERGGRDTQIDLLYKYQNFKRKIRERKLYKSKKSINKYITK